MLHRFRYRGLRRYHGRLNHGWALRIRGKNPNLLPSSTISSDPPGTVCRNRQGGVGNGGALPGSVPACTGQGSGKLEIRRRSFGPDFPVPIVFHRRCCLCTGDRIGKSDPAHFFRQTGGHHYRRRSVRKPVTVLLVRGYSYRRRPTWRRRPLGPGNGVLDFVAVDGSGDVYPQRRRTGPTIYRRQNPGCFRNWPDRRIRHLGRRSDRLVS